MREMPKNIELEKSVIGLIVSEPAQYNEVATIVSEDCFMDNFCRKMYLLIKDFDRKGEKFDALILAETLEGKTTENYLLMNDLRIVSYNNIAEHAMILKQLSLRRSFYVNLGGLIDKSIDTEVDIFETINEMSRKLGDLENSIGGGSTKHISEIIPDALEEIEKASESTTGISGIPTLMKSFDKPLSGLNKGELVIIAGRPGMGKTAYALNAALNMSGYQNVSGLFISLEMRKEELVKRMISTHCSIDNELIRNGTITEDDYMQMHAQLQGLIEANFYIDDQSGIDLVQIKSKIRQAVIKHDIQYVMIDYLQLINVDNSNRVVSIGEVTTKLKQISKEFDIGVILLSQLSRKCEERADKRPMASDLRDSGNIEQDADAIILLYRDIVYNPNPTDINGNRVEDDFSEAIICKNRHGETGIVPWRYVGKYFKVEDYKDLF